jgi:hypothetical protein
MRIVTNEKVIKRNARIGQFTGLVGLLMLVYGAFISFSQPEQVGLSFGALLIGFALSQVGIYFGNRYARRPRPDEALNQALKKLSNAYTLYHYSTAANHLLVGPAGIWALFPKYQRGRITYEKGKWKQRGGGIGLAYLKLFAQEGLGRPDLEISVEVDALKKALVEDFPDLNLPDPMVALVFTNPKAEIDADEADIPTLKVEDLRKFVNQFGSKGKMRTSFANAIYNNIVGELDDEEEIEEYDEDDENDEE